VAIGSPFTPQRQFSLTGNLNGVAGFANVYAGGYGFFDTAQPNTRQFGLMTVNTAGGQLSESSRSAVKLNGQYVDVDSGELPPNPAIGSVYHEIALDTGVSNGVNVIQLLAPSSISSVGTLKLQDPNLLTGLSPSVHPGLVGSALIDVQGNIQSFRALDATGMVLNDIGQLNLAKIATTLDSTIIGEPVAHLQMPHRTNVVVISSDRGPFGDRNGVVVVPNLRQVGPLTLPSQI
jgi:hypothetical protein